MADVLYVIITVAFFALAAGFVRVCDRIIGPDPAAVDAGDGAAAPIERVGVEDLDRAMTATVTK